ncbi:M20 metallopeptidase family protein [Nonomuraea sp. NPDC003707]
MTIADDARTLHEHLLRLRHDLHTEPEIGLTLTRTQHKLLQALHDLPLEISTGNKATSITAVLRGARPGPTVLLRADMDALALHEHGDADRTSRFPGRMHACGHDMHATMLAGAARLLSDRRHTLHGNVIFMFQPGEEGHAGARIMIEEGVLDAAGPRPAAAYSLHVVSAGIPRGVFVTRAGCVMAGRTVLTVTVRGAGGHAALPHLAKDPLPAACRMVTALSTIRLPHQDPVTVSAADFHAGTTHNVIADQARFFVTIRSPAPRLQRQAQDRAVRLLRDIAAAHDLAVDIDTASAYPPTVNAEHETAFVHTVARDLYGQERTALAAQPSMAAEDFSFVLEEIPGAVAVLGACPADRDPGRAPANHSSYAAFDDAVLTDGAAMYAELAARRTALPT